MRLRHSTIAWAALAAGWALLIWGLMTATDLPAERVVDWVPPLVRPWQDKVGHAALFFVQAALVERATLARLGWWRALLLALGLCLALGAATELRQRSLPTRDADPADFAADALGGAVYAGALAASWRSARGSGAGGGPS